MKQNSKNNDNKGAAGFENYYSTLYKERWQNLKAAFAKENDAVEYFVPGSEKPYYLDSASVYASLCLPLQGAENILDLCAAPGGKTVVLASRMSDSAKLSANERSPDRKRRLTQTVQTCLPEEINSRIITSCSDGATWCKRQTECFDRILLDAPCSSERHVINDEKYLNDWSLSRIKTVTMEQWALLSCSCRLLSKGGYLLYSTCALCPDENELMIERLLKKFNKEGEVFAIVEPSPDPLEIKKFTKISLPKPEPAKYGYYLMPDTQNGAGPIYFCLLYKKESI